MNRDYNKMEEGSIVWIEISATGTTLELEKFYSALFPSWTFHSRYDGEEVPVAGYELPEGVTKHYGGLSIVIANHQAGLGGGIVKMPVGCQPVDQANGVGFTIYYKVGDLEKTQAKVHELGGKTALEKTKQGEGGYYMNFLDPQGNRFGAYQFAKQRVE